MISWRPLTSVVIVWLLATTSLAAQARKFRVAVLPFENVTRQAGDAWMGLGVAEMLTTKLAAAPGVILLERAQIAKVVSEQALGQSGVVDEKTAVEVGRLLGVEKVVVGSFLRVGDRLQVNARLVDTRSGEVSQPVEVNGPRERFFGLMTELARGFFRAEAVAVTAETEVRLKREETRSLSAYEYYMKAFTALTGLTEEGTWRTGTSTPEGRREARRWVEQALSVDPQYTNAIHLFGEILSEEGDHGGAISQYNRALALDPRLAVAYNTRGQAYHAQGQWAQAIADYTQALEFAPRWAEPYKNRGYAYSAQEQYVQAIPDLRRAVELHPTDPKAWTTLGLCLEKLGRRDEARSAFRQAIEVAPDNPWTEEARKGLKRLGRR